MSYFGKLYLDKEKDIVVHLDMDESVLSYTIFALNHKSDNLINNLAIITKQETVIQNGILKSVTIYQYECRCSGVDWDSDSNLQNGKS